MDFSTLKILLDKVDRGVHSEEDLQGINDFYNTFDENLSYEQTVINPQLHEDLLLDRIHAGLSRRPLNLFRSKNKLFFAAAAAVFIIISTAILIYSNTGLLGDTALSVTGDDKKPGRSAATLTLANGIKLELTAGNAGRVFKQGGSEVLNHVNGTLTYRHAGTDAAMGLNVFNTLTTAKGQTYALVLPDKSKVYLNSASKITFAPGLLEHGTRTVRLEGEAYFEVAKDSRHPFIIHTADQEIKVLGTHFNVNSYVDEPAVTTTLLEGTVQITTKNVKIKLKAGEQAINSGKSVHTVRVDPENFIDWKQGDFNLARVDFKSAMRKIARWYDVDVVYDPALTDNIESVGWISRNKKLSTILKFIESSQQVRFELQGRTLRVFSR